ncbi:hypothetical protein BKA82DRAFT_4154617, partial [Pisolithus tinctorius]
HLKDAIHSPGPQLLLDHDVPLKPLPSLLILSPTSLVQREIFRLCIRPTEILNDVIEGGYNFVHILDLDTGESGRHFPFTCTAVGCMLYCQQHPDLNIPTPAIYAYNCTYGSEFIAMEYIDGDTLNTFVEIMRTMRTKTSFKLIGGIRPDGCSCPLVDGRDAASGRGVVDGFGLYNIGPYASVREYVQSVFDRQFHHMDQMLHKGTLLCLQSLTPEEAFELVKRKRDDFMAQSYDWKYPS